MMNRQSAFVKSGLGLALCFLMVGAGVTPPVYAANNNVAISQQARKVTGLVTDAKGEPLLGVNVVVKGTTNGTITDLDGKYSLDVEPNALLQVSYIGYVTQTVPVTGNVVNITLKEDAQKLDEVVVTGYSTQQKKDITGSVAVVDTKDLLQSSGSSASQQLQGKAAGVYVGQSGSPGSATMVRIRGINTVNDNGPLYVIDGVSTRNQDMSSLNPNDIESMQVLKDASSAAIYGAQAANGVILITTKKGTRSGQPKLTYDGYVGMQKTHNNYNLLNAADRLALEWESQQNSFTIRGKQGTPTHPQFGSGNGAFIIPNYLTTTGAGGRQDISMDDYSFPNNQIVPFADTDWWDELDRVALMQNHQISLAGGNEKGTYNLSANYFKQDGTVINSYYQRYQVRANTQFNVRDWLRVGENLTYAFTKDNGLNNNASESNPYSWVYRTVPYVPVKDERGNWVGSKIAGTGNWANPVADAERSKDNYWSNSRIFGNLWAEADLWKGLTLRTNFGLDYTNNYSYNMNKKNLEFSESPGTNNLQERSGYNFRWVWTNTLTYNATFNDIHKLNVVLGTEAIRDGLGRSMYGQRYDYLMEDNPNTWILNMGANDARRIAESNYKGEFALFGMFARADYSFADKYLLTGIVRRDGVSRFSKDHRYGVFPSFSLGWRMSEEGFMENTRDWLDDLKLRVGYGVTGNSEMPRITNFAYEFATDPTRTNYDLQGSNSLSDLGFRLYRFGNPDTKWEATKMTNVGLDATFLNGKFGVGLEWYYKKTSDMLLAAAYSALAGEAGKPYLNYGDMKNTGVDFNFNYRDSKGDWSWDINFNASHYKNEVVKLSDSEDFAMYGYGARLDGPVTRTTAGHPIAEFYGLKVEGFYNDVNDVKNSPLPYGVGSKDDIATDAQANAYVGKFKYADVNGDGKVDANDRTVIGNPHPDLIMGLNATINWKNWDFTMFWYSTIGNDLYNNTKAFTDFQLFRGNRSERMWKQSWRHGADNSNAVLPILDSSDSKVISSSYFVENGSFLRLKNVVLGYTLPKELLKKATIQNLRFYIQAENLLTITGYDGLDPEFTNANVADSSGDLMRGVDMGGWPTTLRLMFGVNFAF